jgi:hypothetical protein
MHSQTQQYGYERHRDEQGAKAETPAEPRYAAEHADEQNDGPMRQKNQ